MQLEATQEPIKYRLKTGQEVTLKPGVPMEVPDKAATQLLKKAPDKVRLVPREVIVMEPAIKPDGNPLSAIYWERGDGSIVGPAQPEFFARIRDIFWIVTTFEGSARWINADLLRSRKAFEQQSPVREAQIIREDHR